MRFTEKDLYGVESPPPMNIDPREAYRMAGDADIPIGTGKFVSDIAKMFQAKTESIEQRIALLSMLETVFIAGVMYSKQELCQEAKP